MSGVDAAGVGGFRSFLGVTWRFLPYRRCSGATRLGRLRFLRQARAIEADYIITKISETITNENCYEKNLP